MTRGQYMMALVSSISCLLDYLPHCETAEEQEAIMEEVRRMRKIIMQIEELTMTERGFDINFISMSIESDFINN